MDKQGIAANETAIARSEELIARAETAIAHIERVIASLDHAVAPADQAIARLEQAVALSDQAIARRHQATARADDQVARHDQTPASRSYGKTRRTFAPSYFLDAAYISHASIKRYCAQEHCRISGRVNDRCRYRLNLRLQEELSWYLP